MGDSSQGRWNRRTRTGVRLLLGLLLSIAAGTLAMLVAQGRIFDQWAEQELQGLRQGQEEHLVGELRGRVESAHSVAERLMERLPPERARALAMEAIESLRFDEDNYVWVHQLDRGRADSAFMLVHAAEELAGRDLSGLVDLEEIDSLYLDGTTYPKDHPAVAHVRPTDIFTEFNRVCLEEGHGVVPYYWPKVVDGRRTREGYPKISYVQFLPEWDWVIGAGAYADFVDRAVAVRAAELAARNDLVRRRAGLSVALVGLVVLLVVLVLVGTSMADQRRYTEALSASERTYREVFEGVDDALVVIDPDTLQIVDANEAALNLYGVSRERLVGRDVLQVGATGGDWDGATLEAHLRLAREEGLVRFHWRAMRSPGEVFWADVAVRRATIADEERLLASIRDATERLAARVALERALVEARAASEAKGRFLANMSHEIRTPMSGVLGMTSLLVETELDDDQRDLAATAQRSARDLLAIVDDILDFSRVEAGRLELEEVDWSLREVLDSLAELVGRQAVDRGLRYHTVVGSGVPDALLGAPGRVRQVLVNLVSNAVKFTAAGQVTLSVRLQGERLAYEVWDTGAGIAEDRLDELFDAFTQVDASATREHGGVGLGLAISRGLVELMGGELVADSEEGVGSVFRFSLPLREARVPRPLPLEGRRVRVVEDDPTRRAELVSLVEWLGCAVAEDGEVAVRGSEGGATVGDVPLSTPLRGAAMRRALAEALGVPSGSISGERHRSWEGRTVLLAEDNAVNRKLATRLLERRGLEVVVVEDGIAAVERGLDLDWDLVLMDCQMPRLDGYEATRRLREAGRTGPIVALTAHALVGDRDRSLEAGMDDHLPKPLRPDALDEVLGRWLDGGSEPSLAAR